MHCSLRSRGEGSSITLRQRDAQAARGLLEGPRDLFRDVEDALLGGEDLRGAVASRDLPACAASSQRGAAATAAIPIRGGCHDRTTARLPHASEHPQGVRASTSVAGAGELPAAAERRPAVGHRPKEALLIDVGNRHLLPGTDRSQRSDLNGSLLRTWSEQRVGQAAVIHGAAEQEQHHLCRLLGGSHFEGTALQNAEQRPQVFGGHTVRNTNQLCDLLTTLADKRGESPSRSSLLLAAHRKHAFPLV
mmetsp:Transcript_130133/g.417585  ORF Transcript_130133/g.417585 Transcript_130133/m.417585 type:complete len:248 (-) Transcript_130133:537-1280(-)